MSEKKNISLAAGLIVFFSSALLLVTGCMPTETIPMEELFSPTPSLTTTPTVIWFPATATPTTAVIPTATPNPAANPSYGSALFSDNFSSSGVWQDAQNANGIISVGNDSITLAVKAEKGSLFTLRSNTIVSDFYLETTVKRVALCRDTDQYGVLFRAQDEQNFYRLMVNCQGMVAVQQVAGSTPSFLMDWVSSSDATQWKPFTLGVWAKGQTIRIYINDHLQGEITRNTFRSGGVGYFAKAAADTPLTVSFSDLTVYELNGSSEAISPTNSITK